jgi:hypothetical protein
MTPEKLNDLRNELQAIIELAQAADWQRKRAGFCLDGQLPKASLPGAVQGIKEALLDVVAVAARSLAMLRAEEQYMAAVKKREYDTLDTESMVSK